MNNIKYIWIAIAIIGVVIIGILVSGRSITQIIQNPLGAVSNPYNMGPEVGWNGVNRVASQGAFINASTTIVGFKNPTAATTTIISAILKQTGVATTTARFNCGTSYLPSGVPQKQTFTISASTATSTSWGTMFYTASTTATGLTIDPNEYILCQAVTTGIGSDAGFTNANNTFAGTYWFEFLVGR